MDQFIQDINSLIYIANEPVGKQPLIEHNIIEKQYIVYYLYRILCKYEELFSTNLSYQKVRDIYDLLRIPNEKKRGCYPMSLKMTSNKKLLDLILTGIIELFNQLNENLKMTMTNNNFLKFTDFLGTKTLEVILKDLIELHQLVPNLSAPIIKPYLYNRINTPITSTNNTTSTNTLESVNNTTLTNNSESVNNTTSTNTPESANNTTSTNTLESVNNTTSTNPN